MNLSGVFPPLTTPFGADGELLLGKLESNIEKLNLTGLAGYVVLGSTGEVVYLSKEEKLEILRTARAAAAEGKLLIAGTAEESLRATLEMTARAAELDYHAVMIRTPHYYKAAMDRAAEVTYYKMVADASALPVIIYNFPQVTGIDLAADIVAELAEHRNIIGIKESSGSVEKVTRMLHLTAHVPPKGVAPGLASRRGLRVIGVPASESRPDVIIETIESMVPSFVDRSLGFQVLVGNTATLYPSLCVGASGSVLGVANAAPVACLNVLEAYRDGEHTIAREKQSLLIDAHHVVAQLSIPAIKHAMDLNSYYGGPPRLPMLPLTASQRERVEAAFAKVPH
jgi:dihydrodipicolinate synthase/N-acetylneuraminate lyase